MLRNSYSDKRIKSRLPQDIQRHLCLSETGFHWFGRLQITMEWSTHCGMHHKIKLELDNKCCEPKGSFFWGTEWQYLNEDFEIRCKPGISTKRNIGKMPRKELGNPGQKKINEFCGTTETVKQIGQERNITGYTVITGNQEMSWLGVVFSKHMILQCCGLWMNGKDE